MSRFPEVGKVVLLSFPRFKGDFIEQRMEAYVTGQEEKTWGIKAATWESNPTITREMLEPEFRRNAVEANMRFACIPPEMSDEYFREPELVRAAFLQEDDPVNEDGTYKEWFNGTDGFQRFSHVDLAQLHDHAALCMVHCVGMKEVNTSHGIVETLPIIKQDFIKYWSAVMKMQVLSTGVCLVSQDESARREFEMYAYSDYARLNEERREIVKGITNRGLVYG